MKKPTENIGLFFDTHPTVYKIVLLANHLFRAAMMVGFMYIPHMPFYAGMGICLAGSLFYRLTVERNCAYKFALPAFVGAAAFMLALPAIISMVNRAAFVSTASTCKAVASLLPLLFYAIHIILTVNHDVNKNAARLRDEEVPSCCKGS